MLFRAYRTLVKTFAQLCFILPLVRTSFSLKALINQNLLLFVVIFLLVFTMLILSCILIAILDAFLAPITLSFAFISSFIILPLISDSFLTKDVVSIILLFFFFVLIWLSFKQGSFRFRNFPS